MIAGTNVQPSDKQQYQLKCFKKNFYKTIIFINRLFYYACFIIRLYMYSI